MTLYKFRGKTPAGLTEHQLYNNPGAAALGYHFLVSTIQCGDPVVADTTRLLTNWEISPMNNKPIAENWYEVEDIGNDVSLIRETHVASWLRCNIWHVRGRDFDLVIDTGMGLRPLKKDIAQIVEKPVKAVLTHSHFDHMGGANQFDCRLGHSAEADLFADPGDDDPNDKEPYFPFVRAETFKALPFAGFDHRSYRVRSASLTGHLDEGDVLDLGDRVFQIFHLPGHSPGSIALYEKKTRILFSGDVVYDGDLLDSTSHSDPVIYRESLKRLKQLPVSVVHGGHFPSFDEAGLHRIIDCYFKGGQRMGDCVKWVNARIAEEMA